MFQLVLWAYRPPTTDELLHALTIPIDAKNDFNLTKESFLRRVPTEPRIVHCGGNFLEIRNAQGQDAQAYVTNLFHSS